ncbi:hypothetical protein QN360_12540, partial [Glaciimonas sp. CA11.2]|uniref:hypothetical protein n=1 Tax=Glaciimonas sp. CA11.2 TaxID=3048601 RepID=UPI002B229857
MQRADYSATKLHLVVLTATFYCFFCVKPIVAEYKATELLHLSLIKIASLQRQFKFGTLPMQECSKIKQQWFYV